MWEKLNNSSLLFNKSFIQAKEQLSVYSDRVFFNRMYFYYINKGYYNIIITSIVNLIITNFLVFFIIFMINCIDYTHLFSSYEKTSLVNYMDIKKFFNLGVFMTSIISLFVLLDVIKIISLIDDIYIYNNIRKFYNNNLKIRDSDIEYLKWNNIIEIYKETHNDKINPFYINNIITMKENYFLALLDNNLLKPFYLNGILECNLMYCIIYSITNSN